MRQCPECHGEVEDDDIVCLHCLSQIMPTLADDEPAGEGRAGLASTFAASPPAAASFHAAFIDQPADPQPQPPPRPAERKPTSLYDASSPTDRRRLGRRFSASLLRIVAFVTVGVALLLIGYLLGQWNASPAQQSATPTAFDEGLALYEQGRYQAALHAFGMAADAELRAGGAAAPALAHMGWSAYRDGDYPAAVEYFGASLGQDAGRADSYAGLGLTNLEKGDPLGARRMFDAALALDDALPAAHRGLGQLYIRQGQIEPALEELRRAVALAPQDAENRAALGLALHAAGADADAIPELEAAMAGAPASLWRNALIESYWTVGRYDDALGAARGWLAADSAQARPHYVYGLALWRAGRLEEAHAAFDEALGLGPALPLAGDALRMLGVTLAQRERYAEALDPLGRALALRPDDAAALTERGWALARLGRCAEALDDFAGALAVEPALDGALEGQRACQKWLGQ